MTITDKILLAIIIFCSVMALWQLWRIAVEKRGTINEE
jgi:hypothetical protein